ncbi:TRAFAC clade GTPase domain-containing protein [Herbidospora daliensis]|uniref:TRAFAC clade GTPase domain-containing protein n=1 Tax=Herbidospora daliensis TaxID=295585 RepID=UPI0007866BE0|nr:zinc ribbon domain-containing protein [Herbidospora daliensis]
MWWLVLVGFWLVAMWAAFAFVFPVVFAATVVVAVLGALAAYFATAARVLLPDQGVRGPPEGAEPAYRHYLVSQVWHDWWSVLAGAVPVVDGRVRRVVRALTKLLMSDERRYVLFPLWLAVVAGLLAALLPLSVVALLVTAAYLVTAVTGLLAWLAFVGVLRGAEQSVMLLRRILQACPYPGCYARIARPIYACPSCGAQHRALRPDRNGAFRHVCRCGARLPTTILLGRHRLRALCPHCGRTLPGKIGKVRVEPVPLVGGPDAGKTTFLAVAVDALRETSGARFVDQGDEQTFLRLRNQLAAGTMTKTGTQPPKAVILDVSARILYLFDPSGEHYTGASRVEAMGYLAHGEAMVLLIDPFALPAVQDSLVPADRELLAAGGVVPSREDPADTVHRVRNELSSRADGGHQRRIAVVVTKGDLLDRTTTGQGAAADPRAWLTTMGMGNLVRDLANRGSEVRYTTSGLPPKPDEIAGLVTWLTGLTGERKADGAAGEPWRPGSRPAGRPPLSYTVVRRLLFAASALLSAGAVAAAILWFTTRT